MGDQGGGGGILWGDIFKEGGGHNNLIFRKIVWIFFLFLFCFLGHIIYVVLSQYSSILIFLSFNFLPSATYLYLKIIFRKMNQKKNDSYYTFPRSVVVCSAKKKPDLKKFNYWGVCKGVLSTKDAHR